MTRPPSDLDATEEAILGYLVPTPERAALAAAWERRRGERPAVAPEATLGRLLGVPTAAVHAAEQRLYDWLRRSPPKDVP